MFVITERQYELSGNVTTKGLSTVAFVAETITGGVAKLSVCEKLVFVNPVALITINFEPGVCNNKSFKGLKVI